MAVSISLSITQNSQSIANNTSNVTVKLTAKWTGGSYNRFQKSGWVTIDGTKYTFTSDFNYNKTTSGSEVIFTKTLSIAHNADGTKTLACSASYTSGVSSGTVTASASKALTTIPRASSLTASNGTLGTAQTLTINRASSGFTHTVTYKCGTASGTIATKTSSTSLSFTPPLNLASQNTSATAVTVVFTITTYSGSTQIGTATKSISCAIPASVVPSISNVTITEGSSVVPSGFGFVQTKSQLQVVTTAAGSYGSTISGITVTYDGIAYSGANVKTNTVNTSGSRTVTITARDSRGRTATVTRSVTIMAYAPPTVDMLSVERCDEDGTLNEQGEYAKISYSAGITALGNANAKSFKVRMRKTSEESYSTQNITAASYAVSGSVILAADSGSSYDVLFVATDSFYEISRHVSVQTAISILNINANGTSISFGKISELEGVFDVAFMARFQGGVLPMQIADGADLDEITTTGFYVGDAANGYVNCPLTGGTFILDVESAGSAGQLIQHVSACSKTSPLELTRAYYSGAWGEWIYTTPANAILWSGALQMDSTQTIALSMPISRQCSGIELVFSRYSSDTAQNYNWNSFFVSKRSIASHGGAGRLFMLSTDGTFGTVASKYLYISDSEIKGNANNILTGTANGITYKNTEFVLRYVNGV